MTTTRRGAVFSSRTGLVAVATLVVTAMWSAPLAFAHHDSPDGSTIPEAATHEAKPSPPIPMATIGECQELILYQTDEAPGSTLVPLAWLAARHGHLALTTGVGNQFNHCSLPQLGGQFALRADVGTDGQADLTADPLDPAAAPGSHGETLTQSWSSSSGFCGALGVANGFPANANKGTVRWNDEWSSLSGPWHGSDGASCADNWVKFVAGSAASEGAAPGAMVLWGQLRGGDLSGPICFRADLARVARLPGGTTDREFYQGTFVLFHRGAFVDSRSGYVGAATACDGPGPAPSLVSPADGGSAAFDTEYLGVPFVVDYGPSNWESEGVGGSFTPVVEVTDANGVTTSWSSPNETTFGWGTVFAPLPPGQYTWTARARVRNAAGGVGLTPRAAPARAVTVTSP